MGRDCILSMCSAYLTHATENFRFLSQNFFICVIQNLDVTGVAISEIVTSDLKTFRVCVCVCWGGGGGDDSEL